MTVPINPVIKESFPYLKVTIHNQKGVKHMVKYKIMFIFDFTYVKILNAILFFLLQ